MKLERSFAWKIVPLFLTCQYFLNKWREPFIVIYTPLFSGRQILVQSWGSSTTTATATTTKTPQNNDMIGEKRKNKRAASCDMHFSTYFCGSLQNNDVNLPNLRFRPQREYISVNFYSSTLLWKPSYQFVFGIFRPHCTTRTRWNNGERLNILQSFFEVTLKFL